jgi:hypothetical protein
MRPWAWRRLLLVLLVGATAIGLRGAAFGPHREVTVPFPTPLDAYGEAAGRGVIEILAGRIAAEPFNLVASVIFLLAVVHTFLAGRIRHWAHRVDERHQARLREAGRGGARADADEDGVVDEVSFAGQILHFLGEVEVIFGIWVIALAAAITWFKGWDTAVYYIGEKVNYTEPMFVVVIMTMASTRPIVRLAELCLRRLAALGRGSPAAWWLSILIFAPLLGSFITEPAAMTIAALLLAKQFYELNPGVRLKYATIGLLFVNVSVGGTFTHFAAPPVLMVAAPWKWNLAFMFLHFGWRAGVGIVVSTLLYFVAFRRELAALRPGGAEPAGTVRPPWRDRTGPIPVWITLVHVLFLGFTVWQAHEPVLFIAGFLFFLGFAQATAHHQNRVDLRPALLVGFFLAGLVNHGGVQGWWLQPVLQSLDRTQLMLGATLLTAFNDNAAITYLATLVPNFTEAFKYAVVVGAVTGGGLTVIANAPNPAGQAILGRYFRDGVAPLWLAVGALVPTIILGCCFMLL